MIIGMIRNLNRCLKTFGSWNLGFRGGSSKILTINTLESKIMSARDTTDN